MNGFVLSGELRPVMFVLRLGADDLLGLADARRALDAHDGRLAEVGGDAVVALERRLDDLLLDLAVERDRDLVAVVVLADVDERVLLGELASAARSEPCCSGRRAKTTASSAGRGKRAVTPRPGGGSPIASPTRTAPSPRIVAISPAARTSRRGAPAGAKTWIEVAFASSPPPTRTRWRAPQRAGEQADVGDALAGRGALDLEHAARTPARPGRRVAAESSSSIAGEQRVDAGPVRGRAEEHGVDDAAPRLDGQLLAEPRVRERRLVADVRAEDRLVVLGEDLGQRRPMRRRRPP